MTDFIPHFPLRHKKSLGPLDIVKYASRDLLSIWPEEAFERQFMSTRIINRSIFIANCPDVIRHVLITHHSNYEKKSPLLRKAFAPLLGDSLFISDGETWQQRRQIGEALFNPEQIPRYASIMIQASEQLIADWANLPPSTTVNVLPAMLNLSTEIIFRMLFGEHADRSMIPLLIEHMADYHTATGKMDLNTFFGLPSWLPGVKRNQATQIADAIHQIVDKLVAHAINTPDSLTGHFKNHGLTHIQIRHELLTLFMTGQEAVANTLSWAWYLISQCPEVEQRLHEEVDAVLTDATATFTDFAKLSYTRAILEETMRLYPPVPLIAREASNEDIIRKRPVPAGSIMLIVPWLLHRHKHYSDKPDHFIPERFLDDTNKPQELTYLPFSGGTRTCLAQFLGTVETTLCLAVLAKHIRLTLPKGQTVTHESRLTLRPKDKLQMQLFARN